MKNKLKGLLAVVLSLACFLSTTPIVGFAAGDVNGETDSNKEFEYKVIFDLNGGEGEIEPVTAKYGTEITLPDSGSAAKEGFKLTGWNTAKDGSGDNYAPAASVKNLTETENSEITLYAQWDTETQEAEKFTVTYYLSDDEQFGEAQSYEAGAKIELPAPPAKEGFEFAGWILGEKDGEAIKMPEFMPAENIKAYASWEVKSYQISYTVDGTNYLTKVVPYGSDIALTAPEDPAKEGYIFAGWFDKNGTNLYSYATVPANDVEFTAKWLKNGNVVYIVDGKTYEAYEVAEGQSIPVPEDPEKFAHIFDGWTPAIPAVMPAEDLTFTAKWKVDKDFVALVIGGTVIAGGVIAAIAGTAITGVSIIGGIFALLGITSGINKTYTVTYKVDGKVYKTYKHESGDKITVPADPTKDGYKFAGWTPEIPDKMPKKNLTFTATWENKQDDSNVGGEIPSTGSTAAGITAFAALAISAAVALIIKKKKEN